MNPTGYILSTLQTLAQPLPMASIGKTPLEDAIFAKVMSKKFRKVKADEHTIDIAKRGIHTAVETGEPITVSFLFGGNKLWRFNEAPEIDWAELFAVSYFVRWMKSIASVYEPGVRLDFYSEAIAVESLNNVTRAETEQYAESFKAMLAWLQPYVPANISITYRQYGDAYASYEEYLQALEVGKARVLEANNGQLPTLTERQKIATDLNVRLLPTQADDPLWREKVVLIHRGLEETDVLRAYLNDPIIIRACPTSYSGWIAVGSTKRSYAKFWAGVGALEQTATGFNELVLPPSQIKTANFTWQDIQLEGLTNKNFQRIRIIE